LAATKIPTVQRISPPAPPAVAASKEGYIKVRLAYLTQEPKHIRNLILRQAYGIKPPYNEDTCILVPAAKCFADFESYMGAFDLLQAAGVLHPEDILLDVTVLIEDENTLAYIV
jgi:hypothetical protein